MIIEVDFISICKISFKLNSSLMAICYPYLVNTTYVLQKLLHFYKVTWSLKFSHFLQQTHQELCAVQICGWKLNLLWSRIVLSKLYHFHAVFNDNGINRCCYEFQVLPAVQIWWRQSFLKIWFLLTAMTRSWSSKP